MRLAVVLIVRDEQHQLPGALHSLEPLRAAGVLGGVHVHDTGSSDATLEVARQWGTQLSQGPWTGDFAAARNAALQAVTDPWVLSLDADERVRAEPDALAALLATPALAAPAACTLLVENTLDTGDYAHRAERLFTPVGIRWEGRVHERLRHLDGSAPNLHQVPPAVLSVVHEGYAGPAVRRAKSERNAALAQAELDALAGSPDPDPVQVARVLLDLGRSLVGAGRAQAGVDAFEALRALAPGTPEALRGTDALARLLLGAGLYDVVLHLSAELRAAGARPDYCSWLAAQAHAQLGDVSTAYALVSQVREVVDTAGRHYPPADLEELRHLLAALVEAQGPGVALPA